MKMSRSATFRYRGGEEIFQAKPSRIWRPPQMSQPSLAVPIFEPDR